MRVYKVQEFDKIYYKTYAYRRSLDTFPNVFKDDVYQLSINKYADYLKERINNPIVTELVSKKVEYEHPIKDPAYFLKNKKKAEQNTVIKNLLAKLAVEEINYSKTQSIRETLLSEGRINLYSITPKLRGIKKFLLKLKVLL